MIKFAITGILLIMGISMVACSDEMNSPERTKWRDLSAVEKALVDADNSFGMTIFRQINESESDNNLFISPLSISFALGMALNGAAGETAAAMRKTLQLQGLDPDEVNRSYQELIPLLSGLDPKVVFTIANSIWYRNTFQAEQDFIDVNKTCFNAEIASLDFSSPAAIKTINNWVDSNTRGKISKIIDRIPGDMMLYLINAIYFKGSWTHEFSTKRTRDDQFQSPAGAVPCKMMQQKREMPYLKTETFQAVD